MRRSRNELRQMDLEEAKKTGQSIARMEEAKRREMGEIEDRYNKIMAEIQRLQDERHELFRIPPTKEALLKAAKQALRAERISLVKTYLKKHLEDCQKHSNAKPFGLDVMKREFSEEKAGRLAPFCFTEEDIEIAIGELEEIGIDEAEREKKIAALDKKIDQLYKSAEKI